jgi:hypothetical protein
MASKKERLEALIRNTLADRHMSEGALERVDEIHRSAIRTASQISGHYDQWSDAYEAALYKELEKRQGEIHRLRRREPGGSV